MVWPFVVMVEFAHRSTASLVCVTRTARPAPTGPASARSTISCGFTTPLFVVFSTLTCRNSADGQPWPTAALWPGWALPQFMAPNTCHVDGPPRPSSDPQNSVVSAW